MVKRESQFQKENSFDKRLAESTRVRKSYPDRVPVVVEKDPRSDVAAIDKKKFLVPADLTVANMVQVVRKRLDLEPEKGLFLFCGSTLPPLTQQMSTLPVDPDGFVYIFYSSESSFGRGHRTLQ